MKNLFRVLFIAVFLFGLTVSCTEQTLENETEQLIDPDKDCPEWDRDCDGKPD